ncbi:MAG: sulfur carrier protein ThiS [Peptococcaceae bacterium]
MQIHVNGKITEITEPLTILEYIHSKNLQPASLVIQYNKQVLKKADWSKISLQENDRLELLSFVGGG